jgi:uncharacterized membrane protein (UPF0127 family)
VACGATRYGGVGHTEPVRDPLLDPPAWAPSWLPTIDDVRGARALRWVVSAVFVAGVAACVTEGADSPADPELGAVTTDVAEEAAGAPLGSLAERFGTVTAQLAAVSGEVLQLCLLHADTMEERAAGLMQVADLEGHDGMLFATEEPSEGAFYMYRTVLPLTISWWDGEGAFVSRADMVPCESEDPAACERYPAGGPFRFAIEVVQGAPLAERFEPGARLQVGTDACAVPA